MLADGHDELADLVRVLRGSHEGHPAAEGEADDVRLVEAEVVDERRDVIGHEPDVDRPIDVGRAPVALEVGEDDLVVLGQRWQGRSEHLAGSEPAVQQDHRPSGAVDLVVEVDAIHIGVFAGDLRLGRQVGGHSGAPRVIDCRVDECQTDHASGIHRDRPGDKGSTALGQWVRRHPRLGDRRRPPVLPGLPASLPAARHLRMREGARRRQARRRS